MPRPMIVGNWKMNNSLEQALELVASLKDNLTPNPNAEIVVCPAFPFVIEISRVLENSSIKIGAQNMHSAQSGAFTGEVSGSMLAGLCEYVILGHSERRSLFGETNRFINIKVVSALDNGLKPILCVGETEQERESGNASAVVRTQVKSGLADVADITSITIAYEPIWAIGTGKIPSQEAVHEIISHGIFEVLQEIYPDSYNIPRILYGGSVTPQNVVNFTADPLIDGVLVGGASLDYNLFSQIVALTLEAKAN